MVDVFWVYFKLNVAYEVISLVEFNMKRDQAVSFLLVLFLLGLTPDAFGASKAIEVDSLLKDFVSLEICESIGSETAFIVLQHYSEHESDLLIFKMLPKTELKSYEYTRMTHYSFMGWTVFIDTNLLCKTCSHLDEESLCFNARNEDFYPFAIAKDADTILLLFDEFPIFKISEYEVFDTKSPVLLNEQKCDLNKVDIYLDSLYFEGWDKLYWEDWSLFKNYQLKPSEEP